MKADPMNTHKCKKILEAPNMGKDRYMWLGELLEPIPNHPEETHCLHIKSPYKQVVWGINLGDLEVCAVFAHAVHKEETGKPINTNWLDRMVHNFKSKQETHNAD